MHRRHHPAKWPLAIATAFALFFGGVLLTPDSWIDFLFTPLDLTEDEDTDARGWLELVPPPEVEVAAPIPEPEKEKPEPPPAAEWQNPDWWQDGWNVRISAETESAMRRAPADSARVVLEALGIGEDFMTRAKPDSVLAARLYLLQLEDSFRLNELRPYLYALGRAEQYRDIMSRKADMFDDFLSREIIAPEIPARPDEEQ